MAAVEWIEDSDRGGRASEFYPTGEGKRGEIGDKIIVGSGGGGTADETQTGIGEGLAHRLEIFAWVKTLGDGDFLPQRLAIAQVHRAGEDIDLPARVIDIIFADHAVTGKF